MTLTLTNNIGATVKGAIWSVGFDPDQDGPGKNTMANGILGTGDASAVKAAGPIGGYAVVLANDTSATAFDITAYIGAACCSPVDAAVAFGGGPAFSLGDDEIALACKFRANAAGQSVSIGYSYAFAVPDPSTYALMLAGLGAVGSIAKCRELS